MATINLKLQLDKSQAAKGFDEISKAPEKLSKAVKKSTAESKKALDDLGKSAPKIPSIAPPITPKEVNAVKAMKKEIRDLESAAIKAGEGTAEYARLLDLAASKKAELKDLKDVVTSLDPDVKAAAFTNLASTAVGAGQGIAGAFALAGFEGEEYQKVLTRLQGIDAIGQGIKSLGQLKDEWSKAKIAINSYLLKLEGKVVVEEVNTAVTAEGAVAQKAATAAAVENVEAITLQTLAQRALTQAQLASPWGAIAIAVGVVGTAIAAYVAHSQSAEKAERLRNTAADGTIFANQELRDSYNELLKAQRDYAIDLEVISGRISKYDGELLKIADTYNHKLLDAQAEYNASLAEEHNWFGKLGGSYDVYNKLSAEAEAAKKLEAAAIQAKIDKQKEELKLMQDINAAREQSSNDIDLEILNNQKALMEAGGKSTFQIQKDIANKEADIARKKVETALDKENQLIIIELQLSQKLKAIDIAQKDEELRIAKEAADERLRIQQDLMAKLAALEKKISSEGEHKLSPEGEAKRTLENNLNAIDALGRESAKKQKNLTAQQKKDLEESLNGLVDESYRNYYDKLTELRQQKIKAEIAADKKSFSDRLDRLNSSQQIEFNDIDLWNREEGESEEAFIKRKEEAKLKLQLQFAQARLQILQEQGADANAVEVSNVQVLIKNLQDEVDKAGKENKKTGREFLKKLFGVDDEGLDAITDSFNNLLDTAGDLTDQIFEKQEEALNKKKELNDRDLEENQRHIDELKAQLQQQLEEQAAGRANNVQGIQDSIAQEQAAREKQLQDQKKIQAEQERLAKQRALVESGKQLSSIISAVANIIEGWSTVPLVGSALGIAAAALMLGSFVGLKAKASAATAPGFYKGTDKAPPGMKWVGERGKELINDPGGYAIMNNKDSMELMKQYNIPAVYKPEINCDIHRHIVAAAKEGRNAQMINVDQKGTEKRLDEIIELNKRPTVRSVTRKRKC